MLLAEVVGGGTLRIFIDHPEGVTLALCERVTAALDDAARALHARGLLARHRAPADQARPLPPLRRPPRTGAHARRSAGRYASSQPSSLSRRSYTGELVGASDTEITLAADGTLVSIPYAQIRRSNLVEE